jgi:protein SCO1/2
VRLTVAILLLVVVLVFGLVVGRQILSSGEQKTAAPELSDIRTYVYEKGRPLSDFELVNEQGEPVTAESLKGHWTFAFVGYTNCPDICPATLAQLRQTDKLLEGELPGPWYLLVSADPEHDTPEKLREYLAFFGEDFHGLTGDLDTLRELAKSLGAVFMHRQVDDRLLVDHSGHLALLDPDGEMIALMQPPHKPEQLARAFREIYQWSAARRDISGE